MRRSISILSFSLLLAACSASDPNSSSTGAYGLDGGAQDGSVGAQCAEVYGAFCMRLIDACETQGEGTLDSCETDEVPACCGSQCAETAITEESVIQQCIADINNETCDLIGARTLPTTCTGVVKQ